MSLAVAPVQKIDFQRVVAELVEHSIGRSFLASASPGQLKAVASDIVSGDLFQFPSVIRAAARLLPIKVDLDDFTHEHVEHLLWIQHRRAYWRARQNFGKESAGCPIDVKGLENAEMTDGFPTIVISPMTVAYEDALWTMCMISGKRNVAIYGQGLFRDLFFEQTVSAFSAAHIHLVSGPREILETLERNGIFLTYADFVYDGHPVQRTSFWGRPWPFSSAFIGLCARDGTMLLPASFVHDADGITLSFREPVQISLPEETTDRRWSRSLVAATVARLVEETILENPVQWQLLVTLVAECQQRAQ
jgi:hypothetical protein